jgi:4-hydroxybenzoate polyprenyltransferase
MGACRFFNVLLGMSAAPQTAGGLLPWLGYEPGQLAAAGGIGVYIAGVTWFARGEVEGGGRPRLLLGVGVMTAALGALAALPRWLATRPLHLSPPVVWPILVTLTGATVVRRCLAAAANPSPARVQAAVQLSIVSLIVLDAEICLLVSGPASALGVLALLAPALLLGRRVSST